MVGLCFSLILQSRLAFAVEEMRNIFSKKTTQSFFDDDVIGRHPSEGDKYDAVNPPPTDRPTFYPSMEPSIKPSSKPSLTPSLTPSSRPTTPPTLKPSSIPSSHPSGMPSIYTCKVDASGNFGNTTGSLKQSVAFRYEVELNETDLLTYLNNRTIKPEEIIVPQIEGMISELMFPYLFEDCINNVTNSTASFSNIEGVSNKPDDIMDNTECNSTPLQGNLCFPVDAKFSLFFKSRRRLVERRQAVDKLKEILKHKMNDGKLNHAHPSIVGIKFIETNAQPIIDPTNRITSQEVNSTSGNSTWLPIALALGGVGVVVGLLLFLWSKRKGKEKNEDSSMSIPQEIV